MEMEKSFELLKSILDNAYDAIITIDKTGAVTLWNTRAEEIFGWKSDEAIGKKVADLIIPSMYQEDHNKGLQHFLDTGEGPILRTILELTGCHKDGREIPIELTISASPLGGTYLFTGIVRDLTDHKQAEKDINSLSLFPSENPNPVLRISREGKILYANKHSTFLLNHWGSEVGGSLPEDWIKSMAEVFSSGETKNFDIEIESKTYAFQIVPISDSSYANLYGWEITKQKRAEKELKDRESRSRLLKEIAAAANTASTIEDLFIEVLTKIAHYKSWPVGHVYLTTKEKTSKLISTQLWYLADRDFYKDFREVTESTSFASGRGLPGRVLSSKKPAWIEDVTKDKNFLRAKVAKDLKVRGAFAFPIIVKEEVVGIMEFFSKNPESPDEIFLNSIAQVGHQLEKFLDRNETEKKLQQAREEADAANRAKSDFIANLSHEIRTPLNAILGYAQIFERDKDFNPAQKKGIVAIHRAGNHLFRLINDVLDLSKIEAGKMEFHSHDFDLGSVIQDLYAIFILRCTQNNLDFKIEGWKEGQLIGVYGDQGKLRQVLINLLDNAVKFTDSGNVLLRVTKQKGDHFLFEVIDTGSGIPKEKQATIFQTFQQGEEGIKKGGTGLGLAVSKNQVELMSAKLLLESEPGKGSRFFFVLNLPPARGEVRQKDVHMKSALKLAEGYSVKALIVDDNRFNLDILSGILLKIGVEVEVAENGLEGIEKAREWKADIIFMDYKMPDMSGVDAIKRIHEEHGIDKFKFVIVSASTLLHHRERFLNEGIHGFLGKPINREELLGVLVRLLNVKYEYEEERTPVPASKTLDFSKIKLSESLNSSLKEATKLGLMTELEESIAKVEKIEPDGPDLAEYLQDLADQFDTDKILEILEEIENE